MYFAELQRRQQQRRQRRLWRMGKAKRKLTFDDVDEKKTCGDVMVDAAVAHDDVIKTLTIDVQLCKLCKATTAIDISILTKDPDAAVTVEEVDNGTSNDNSTLNNRKIVIRGKYYNVVIFVK